MRFHRSFFVLIPLAALAIGCGAGASTSGGAQPQEGGTTASAASSPEKAGPTTVQIGQPLTLTEELLGSKTVAVITLSNLRVGFKPGNQFDKPQRGQFIVADVAVNVTAGKFSLGSGDFKLVAADGTAHETTFISTVPVFSATDLTPGQKAAGTIAFDAAKGAEKGARVALKNLLAEGDAGYWTLP